MKKDFLTRLYWACSDPARHFPEEARLGALYEQIEETATAEKCLSTALGTAQMDRLGDLAAAYAQAYEMQGFINGVRMGLMLAEETQGKAVAE